MLGLAVIQAPAPLLHVTIKADDVEPPTYEAGT